MKNTDVRKEWFMQQHFNEVELQYIYECEQKAGKVGDIVQVEEGFCLYNVADTERKVSLCFMNQEHELRRWTERLSYTTSDGKSAAEFEKENGIKDEVFTRKEVWREGVNSMTKVGDKTLSICSGEYALVAKRTASNAYDIMFLNSDEYAEHLKEVAKDLFK